MRKSAMPVPFNAVHDITEKDVARQRYYDLFSEQSWWNIQRQINYNKKQQELRARKYALRVLGVILMVGLICVVVHDIIGKK